MALGTFFAFPGSTHGWLEVPAVMGPGCVVSAEMQWEAGLGGLEILGLWWQVLFLRLSFLPGT